MASIVVSMPVSPPVRQYLSRIAPDDPLPWRATLSSFLGTWLINAMVRKTLTVKEITSAQAMRAGYTCTWRFSVPVSRNAVLLPAVRVREFNMMIMRFLSLELFHEIDEAYRSSNPFTLHGVIDEFRTKRCISDYDLTDENLRKQYLRYRTQKVELAKVTGQVLAPSLIGDNAFFKFATKPRIYYEMNDLISDYCTLPTGFFDFDILPRHEIDGWSGATPVPRFKWYNVRPAKDSMKVAIGGDRTAHGVPMNVTVDCLIISDTEETNKQIEMMKDMRFVLRLNNYKGKTRVVGTPTEYVQMAASAQEFPELQGVGGWRLTFSGDFLRSPAIVS